MDFGNAPEGTHHVAVEKPDMAGGGCVRAIDIVWYAGDGQELDRKNFKFRTEPYLPALADIEDKIKLLNEGRYRSID